MSPPQDVWTNPEVPEHERLLTEGEIEPTESPGVQERDSKSQPAMSGWFGEIVDSRSHSAVVVREEIAGCNTGN